MRPKHPYLMTDSPLVLAHQGASTEAPCNTMAAFHLAVEQGCDALELDIHWTKDGVIVVSHDETVDGCSDGTGFIRDMTLAEVKRLDFGFRFTPDLGETFPFRGRGVQIPTLCEVLTTFPAMRVNMDIKPKNPGSLQHLIRELDSCRALARVLVASFHHDVLQQVRRMNRSLATSASPFEVAALRFGWEVTRPSPGRLPYLALQVPDSAWKVHVVTEAFIERAHAFGVDVHVWTVDAEEEMERLLHMGVDGIVTNRPRLGVSTRNRWIGSRAEEV